MRQRAGGLQPRKVAVQNGARAGERPAAAPAYRPREPLARRAPESWRSRPLVAKGQRVAGAWAPLAAVHPGRAPGGTKGPVRLPQRHRPLAPEMKQTDRVFLSWPG